MNTHDVTLINQAILFATAAHAEVGQIRKYTKEPYIVHPLEVMEIITRYATFPVTEEMLAASVLHDVVEDTQVSLATISLEFGSAVAEIVSDLTDVSQPSDGNRRARKALDLLHTKQASPVAKSVKCADIVSNITSIVEHDPGFARKWVREAEDKLAVCGDADLGLLTLAYQKLADAKNKLGIV
tara:strand:- start:2812 stop:3363 length:552 start_codon:yes stop_codon:yes gene_type:complete